MSQGSVMAILAIPSGHFIQTAKDLFQAEAGQSRIQTWIQSPKIKISYLCLDPLFTVLIGSNFKLYQQNWIDIQLSLKTSFSLIGAFRARPTYDIN